MNPQERVDLKRLMNQHDYQDNTEGIRKLKHSDLIQADIQKMENLKKKHADIRASSSKKFESMCTSECSFLYNSYTDIFNRLIKDELDLGLMSQALVTLKKIEDGEIDQQEGSVLMGKILHRVFVESALKRAEALDNKETEEKIELNCGKNISWKSYKATKHNA